MSRQKVADILVPLVAIVFVTGVLLWANKHEEAELSNLIETVEPPDLAKKLLIQEMWMEVAKESGAPVEDIEPGTIVWTEKEVRHLLGSVLFADEYVIK